MLEDLGRLFDLFGESAVHVACVVREAPATDGAAAVFLREGGEFAGQPGLPDPGRPDHGHQVRAVLLGRRLPDRLEQRQLPIAADQRAGPHPALGRCDRLHRQPDLERVPLALGLHQADRLVSDAVASGSVGLFSHDQAARRRERLQP